MKRVRANGKATIYKTNQSGSKKLSEEIDVKASIIEDENEKQEESNQYKKIFSDVQTIYERAR